MKRKLISGLLLLLVLAGLISCNNDNDLGKLRERELELLDKYIKDNNITVKPTKSGLYYIEKVKGTGDSIKPYDRVHVYYRTWLIDSTLIDENIDSLGRFYDPLAFTVAPEGTTGSVVTGLNEGVQLMKKDGKATLIMPSELAYGQSSSSGVPLFSTLIMEVWVAKVIKSGSN